MNPSWTLDELALITSNVEDRALDEAQGYHFELLGDDLELTSAEQAVAEVQSQLFDGEALTKGAYSNSSASLPVAVVGVDSAALSRGTADLIRVIRRPGMRELTYRAADGASQPTVYDVLHVKPSPQPTDLNEADNVRIYVLALTCKPFARSDTEVVTEAAAVGAPSFTLIDAVSSSTPWSAQDPDSTITPLSSVQSWTPLRYNIMTNPLTSDTYRTQGWKAGGSATSIAWILESGQPGHMSVAGKPTSTSQRVYADGPRMTLEGSGALRWRLRMGSSYTCTYGAVYRWYDTAGKQIGSDSTIPEVPRTGNSQEISATMTPVAGAAYVQVFPYARFNSATGATRTWTAKQVFLGADGASFTGDTPDTATNVYDWTGTPYASKQVQLGLASMVPSAGQVSVTAYHHPAANLVPVLTRDDTWATTASSPFLVVSGKVTGASAQVQVYGAASASWASPDMVTAAADGTFKAYFRVGARSGSILHIRVTPSRKDPAVTATLVVTQLDSATSLPAIGTGRQGKFSIDLQGTMPAEASLQVANSGGVGSNVLIYTAPTNPDFVPALSPSLVAAGTADATSISNKKFTVPTSEAAAATWEVPHGGLVESTYALMARISGAGLTSGSAYTFSVSQQTSPDGGGYYGEYAVTTGKVIAPGTTMAPKFLQLATLRLPMVGTDNDPEAVEGLKIWVSGGTWTIDEAWLFDLVNGSLSHVTLMSPTYPNVTIQAASPSRPRQRYLVDGSFGSIRSLDRGVQVWGNHRLDPALGCDVFAICDAGTPDMSVSARYYPRWDMFAADLDDDGTT